MWTILREETHKKVFFLVVSPLRAMPLKKKNFFYVCLPLAFTNLMFNKKVLSLVKKYNVLVQ